MTEQSLYLALNYARAQRLALDMRCPHCGERFAATDKVTDNCGNRFHAECFTRLIVGSVKHQLKQCSCYGHPVADEEPGETPRIWARRSAAVFRFLRDLDAGMERAIQRAIKEIADHWPGPDTAFRA